MKKVSLFVLILCLGIAGCSSNDVLKKEDYIWKSLLRDKVLKNIKDRKTRLLIMVIFDVPHAMNWSNIF